MHKNGKLAFNNRIGSNAVKTSEILDIGQVDYQLFSTPEVNHSKLMNVGGSPLKPPLRNSSVRQENGRNYNQLNEFENMGGYRFPSNEKVSKTEIQSVELKGRLNHANLD